MKKIVFLFFVLFSMVYTANAQKETFDLTIHIEGLSSDKGTLLVGIYNQKEDFLKKQFKGDLAKIKNKKSVVIFKNLTKGEYAVSFIHDENNNKKMDTNFIGIPKEDYGCSNNARGFMGPPKYDDAKFMLTQNKIITIKL